MGAPAPYSTRFVGASGQTLAFIVPAGYRAVVKSVVAANWDTVSRNVAVTVAGLQVVWSALPVGPSDKATECHVVAYAGERIDAGVSGTKTAVICSGYLLQEGGAPLEFPLETFEVPWFEWAGEFG